MLIAQCTLLRSWHQRCHLTLYAPGIQSEDSAKSCRSCDVACRPTFPNWICRQTLAFRAMRRSQWTKTGAAAMMQSTGSNSIEMQLNWKVIASTEWPWKRAAIVHNAAPICQAAAWGRIWSTSFRRCFQTQRNNRSDWTTKRNTLESPNCTFSAPSPMWTAPRRLCLHPLSRKIHENDGTSEITRESYLEYLSAMAVVCNVRWPKRQCSETRVKW